MGNQNGASAAAVLNNAQIANRMKSIFETSLKLHLTGQYMQVIISSKHLVHWGPVIGTRTDTGTLFE